LRRGPRPLTDAERQALADYRFEHPWCELCAYGGRHQVPAAHLHHIHGRHYAEPHQECNLISLCLACHQRAHEHGRAMKDEILAARHTKPAPA
jgi:hypothetical protein